MKKQTSSKGFAVLSAASLICKVFSFVYLPIQAMLVHDNGNGVISAGFKLYIFIYTLTNAGLPVIISKFVSERAELGDFRGSRLVLKCAFTLIMAFGAVSALFTYLGSGLLAAWCEMPESKLMFMVIAPTFLFTSVACSLRGYFQGRHNMTPTAVSQIIEQIINSVLTAVLEIVFFNYAQSVGEDTIAYTAAGSAAATALAAIGSAAFLSVMFLLVTRRQRRREYRRQQYDGPTVTPRSVYGQILRFCIPAVISCLASSATDIIDTKSCIPLLSGHFTQLQAYALFGIYSTKYQRLLTLPVMFAAPLVTAMIPSLAAAKARRDYKGFRRQVSEGIKINYTVAMPIVAGLTFLAKPIISVIFTTQNEGAPMIVFAMWIALLIAMQTLQSGVLVSLNRPLAAPVNLLAGMAVKILCNYVLIPIPQINIYGALIGNALAWAISIALNQRAINRIMKRKQRSWRFMVLPGFASVVMGLFCLGLYTVLNFALGLLGAGFLLANDVSVLLTIPFGAAVYFAVMIRSGGLTMKDIQRLPMGSRIGSLCRRVPFLRAGREE
jgi:stage V sporulation protein B